MAITSVGYDGTVDEVQWASMVSKVGGYEYGVDKAGDFAVSQSAGTRMITIAAGLAWGRGVMDISDAAAVIQLEPVTTGSRYDLIALRRSWGPANGGPTELVVIKGTSAKTLPSGRQSNPGVTDDQPLALVRVQAGSASLPEIIDLRVWGRNGGQLFAKDDLVRSYINAVGTEINISGTVWERTVSANNSAAWRLVGERADTGNKNTTAGAAPGWKIDYISFRSFNGMIELIVSAVRTGGDIAVGTTGNIENIHVCTVPSDARPKSWWRPLVPGPTGRIVSGAVYPSGLVYLAAVSGSSPITKGTQIQLAGVYFK